MLVRLVIKPSLQLRLQRDCEVVFLVSIDDDDDGRECVDDAGALRQRVHERR